MESKLYTTQEAAKLLKVTRGYLAKLRCNGDGPLFVKIGRKVLYRENDLNDYVQKNLHRNTVYYDAHAERYGGANDYEHIEVENVGSIK